MLILIRNLTLDLYLITLVYKQFTIQIQIPEQFKLTLSSNLYENLISLDQQLLPSSALKVNYLYLYLLFIGCHT